MKYQNEPLLEIKNLKKFFLKKSALQKKNKEIVKAVDDISITIHKGETFGLVGESGCGKSTLAKTIIRLFGVTDGQIIFEGTDIAKMNAKELLPYRRQMQMIFQDPYSSLNPRMSVGEIIGEPLSVHHIAKGAEKERKVKELLDTVGMRREYIHRYPHEFSGGQRQRIGIARAIAINPKFIICDEPTSALDVSIQAQVINLLRNIQKDLGTTYLFISHDLAMVQNIADCIGVMYLGRLVELAESDELFQHPLHPYTQALLSAVPDVTSKLHHERIILKGDVPSPIDLPKGCRFQSRCMYRQETCVECEPELMQVKPNHFVACSRTYAYENRTVGNTRVPDNVQ